MACFIPSGNNYELANRFGVTRYPQFHLVSLDGLRHNYNGYRRLDDFIEFADGKWREVQGQALRRNKVFLGMKCRERKKMIWYT